MTTNSSLARKYRPKTFSDLIGQDVLVKTIANSTKMNRLAKAFLLTGTRGVGKTTTARIIAKHINCTTINCQNPDPCNQCQNCTMIMQFSHPDVIEVDAATNTGVEDVRKLKDTAHYVPAVGKARVYIVDEAHMLSNNAFNALLKIIEEPPEHVYWIFTTTDIKKIPITIMSRCQNFALRNIELSLLSQHLEKIAKAEGYGIEKQALDILSENAHGSMRDGLSLLEQVMLYSSNYHIRSEDVCSMLSMPDIQNIIELLSFIIESNANAAVNKFQQIIANQCDSITLLTELLKILNKLIHAHAIPKNNKTVADQDAMFVRLLQKCSLPTADRMWQILFKGIKDLANFSHQQTIAEILIIRLSYINQIALPWTTGPNDTEARCIKIKESLDAPKQSQQTTYLDSSETLLNLLRTQQKQDLHQILQEKCCINIIKKTIEIRLLTPDCQIGPQIEKMLTEFLHSNKLSHYNILLCKQDDPDIVKKIKKKFLISNTT